MNRSKKHLASQSLGLGKMPICLGLVVLAAPVIVPAADSSNNTATSQTADQRHHFMISKQPLYSALNTIAEQGGVQFVYTDDMVKGLHAPFVSGQFSTREALHKVLAGSGLDFRLNSGNTITLAANAVEVQQPASKSNTASKVETTLAPVTVNANEDYDPEWDTSPYNTNYNRSNSTTSTKLDVPILDTPTAIHRRANARLMEDFGTPCHQNRFAAPASRSCPGSYMDTSRFASTNYFWFRVRLHTYIRPQFGRICPGHNGLFARLLLIVLAYFKVLRIGQVLQAPVRPVCHQ